MAGKKDNRAGINAQKMNWHRFILIAFAVLTFGSLATAEFSVSISPQSGRAFLFENEVQPFELKVINLGPNRETGIQFSATVSDELVLLEKGTAVQKQTFLVQELFPNQATTIPILVKAVAVGTRPVLSVSYGQQSLSHLAAQLIEVRPSPFRLELNHPSFTVSPGNIGSVTVSFFNDSNSAVSDLSLGLTAPAAANVEVPTKPLIVPRLPAGGAVRGIPFEFWPHSVSESKVELTLRAAFSDSAGMHRFEKPVSLEITQGVGDIGFLLVFLILILLGYWVWQRVRPSPTAATKTMAVIKTEKTEKKK